MFIDDYKKLNFNYYKFYYLFKQCSVNNIRNLQRKCRTPVEFFCSVQIYFAIPDVNRLTFLVVWAVNDY